MLLHRGSPGLVLCEILPSTLHCEQYTIKPTSELGDLRLSEVNLLAQRLKFGRWSHDLSSKAIFFT